MTQNSEPPVRISYAQAVNVQEFNRLVADAERAGLEYTDIGDLAEYAQKWITGEKDADVKDGFYDFEYLKQNSPFFYWYEATAKECLDGGFQSLVEAAIEGVPLEDLMP